jgi:hypothetical protein
MGAPTGAPAGVSCTQLPSRQRGQQEIGLIEKYQRHGLDEVLFDLAAGGLSQRKTVGWVRKFLGGSLSPVSIGAVLEQAASEVDERRQQALWPTRYRALVMDGVYLRYRRRGKQAGGKAVLLLAVGVEGNGWFQVLGWLAAESEIAEAYEQLLNRLFRRGLETVDLIVSDCPGEHHRNGPGGLSCCGTPALPGHWFRTLQELVPPLDRQRRRKFRREFWWISEVEDESQLRL